MNVDVTASLGNLDSHPDSIQAAVELLETLRNGLILVAPELIEAAQYDARWEILSRMAENVTKVEAP